MNDYKRRTEEIFERADNEQKQRKHKKRIRIGIVSASLGMCFVLTFGLVLFMPYPGYELPDVSGYSGSAYYDLIKTLNPLTYRKPDYKNNFEKWFGFGDFNNGVEIPNMSGQENNQQYAETTNNQVEGVIEGDLFKRSDRYIYYLTHSPLSEKSPDIYGTDYVLEVYSIAGADSAEISSFTITADENIDLHYRPDLVEIYLSEDCTTVFVITQAFDNRESCNYTAIIPLDVSDVTSIKQKEIVYVSGGYVSSRSSNGELILMTDFIVPRNPDFGDEKQFVPRLGTAAAKTAFSAAEIIMPDGANAARFTVVTLFDGERFTSRLAFLSYAAQVYVDKQDIYLTQEFSRESGDNQWESMTRIARVSYAAGVLTYKGAAEVNGWVKDQYSMDARGGVLRVVTTTSVYKYSDMAFRDTNNTSASLYCVHIDTFEIIAKVENFAPKGEIVRSVRFDGDKAYVCTSIALLDPVFIIDLADLTNITLKDSGVIGGYSTSLIQFSGDTLLGIGYNEMWNLKVELYVETTTAVESLTSYVCECFFSEDFKSYMIDAQNALIGLCVEYTTYVDRQFERRHEYLLLSFVGDELFANAYAIETSSCANTRATVIDNVLYILSSGGLRVVAL